MKYRFVPHPDDELEVDLKFNGNFNEINVYLQEDIETGYMFISQVNDRLTVKDHVLHLYSEFVNPDQLKSYIQRSFKK